MKLAAEELFESLEKEEEQEVREFEIKDNPNIEKIVGEFNESIKEIVNVKQINWSDPSFTIYLKHLSPYTAQVIYQFTYGISNYLNISKENPLPRQMGIFLSALAYKSINDTIHLPVHKIPYLLEKLGYKNNGKTLVIEGDVGNYLGTRMENGKIILKGNAKGSIGLFMKGGSIYFEQEWASQGYSECGEIYHKGKLIVKDGKRV